QNGRTPAFRPASCQTVVAMAVSEHSARYVKLVSELAGALDGALIDAMAGGLAEVRERGGRLFILGVGGGAGHASHAVNDFRKIAGIESYAPTDNVSELTARVNDDGWETVFANWLRVSRLNEKDMLLVFSVGGGDLGRAVVREGRPYPPSSLTKLEILPGVPEACRALRNAGFLLVVVTNQPDIARGTQSREAVDQLNGAISARVDLDDIRVCEHT